MRSIFILGDSISIEYGPYLKRMVEGHFGYDRKRGEEQALADLDNPIGANGGDSSMVLGYLNEEREKQVSYDLLLLNCGLHDIKTKPDKGDKQVPLPAYRDNVEAIVGVARQMAKDIVWVRTTDADEAVHNTRNNSFHRFHEDVTAYNAIADDIMHRHGIPLLDLYSFTRTFGPDAFRDHVHYTVEVRRLQAAYIAGYLERFR